MGEGRLGELVLGEWARGVVGRMVKEVRVGASALLALCSWEGELVLHSSFFVLRDVHMLLLSHPHPPPWNQKSEEEEEEAEKAEAVDRAEGRFGGRRFVGWKSAC